MNNHLHFKSGKFRILQLTDMQDTYLTSPDTVNFTKKVIEETKPDFIILTGDQVKGYGTYFKLRKDKKQSAKETIDNLIKPIAESKIPFSIVFGNHDEFPGASKDFQWNCYKQYENFIGNSDTGSKGVGNDCIYIYSEDGNDVPFCIYCFDSFEKNHDGSYDPIDKTQIEFYIKKRDELIEKYSHTVHALAFQHVPPVEIYECLEECDKNTKGAVQGARSFSDKFYTLPSYAQNAGSFMGENAAAPDIKSGQLEAFSEKNDILGLYFGHDHNNSFVVKYGSIDLGYTQGCGFNIYGPGLKRGARVFDIEEKNPDTYETFTVTYKDVLGHKMIRPIKSFIYTHSPSSVTEAVKIIKKSAAVAGITATGILIIKKFCRRN